MQKALVAGGAGFIGSHLCESLLRDGFQVFCVDNLLTSSKKNITPLLSNTAFSFIKEDVSKPFEFDHPVDFIFHLASPASPNAKSKRSYIQFPFETMAVNTIGTTNLSELALSKNAAFLFASTSEIYGDPDVSPQPETYFGNVNPVGPRSVYDEAKRFGETITMAYIKKHHLNARIIRIFNTFGPNMLPDDGRVISNFIVEAIKGDPITIYGDGTQTRSFCYVSDLVEGIKKAMFAKETSGEIFNLGNSDERTIKEIATIVKELTGSSSKIVHEPLPVDDPKRRCPDIAKARQMLEWEPIIPLKEGLTKTIEYFKSI